MSTVIETFSLTYAAKIRPFTFYSVYTYVCAVRVCLCLCFVCNMNDSHSGNIVELRRKPKKKKIRLGRFLFAFFF